MKICLVGATHPCHNPRLVREADTLADAGHDVRVVTPSHSETARLRRRLVATRRWRFEPVDFELSGVARRGRAVVVRGRRAAAMYWRFPSRRAESRVSPRVARTRVPPPSGPTGSSRTPRRLFRWRHGGPALERPAGIRLRRSSGNRHERSDRHRHAIETEHPVVRLCLHADGCHGGETAREAVLRSRSLPNVFPLRPPTVRGAARRPAGTRSSSTGSVRPSAHAAERHATEGSRCSSRSRAAPPRICERRVSRHARTLAGRGT
jgi:hypothetical protein